MIQFCCDAEAASRRGKSFKGCLRIRTQCLRDYFWKSNPEFGCRFFQPAICSFEASVTAGCAYLLWFLQSFVFSWPTSFLCAGKTSDIFVRHFVRSSHQCHTALHELQGCDDFSPSSSGLKTSVRLKFDCVRWSFSRVLKKAFFLWPIRLQLIIKFDIMRQLHWCILVLLKFQFLVFSHFLEARVQLSYVYNRSNWSLYCFQSTFID